MKNPLEDDSRWTLRGTTLDEWLIRHPVDRAAVDALKARMKAQLDDPPSVDGANHDTQHPS